MKLQQLLQRGRGGVLLLGAPEGAASSAAADGAAADETAGQVSRGGARQCSAWLAASFATSNTANHGCCPV